ncbi:hypothetical protein E3D37_42200, partial [Burkholderia cepacia]
MARFDVLNQARARNGLCRARPPGRCAPAPPPHNGRRAQSRPPPLMESADLTTAFSPLQIGPLTLRNRLI